MTRPYALARLLEHGPLTFGELREVTGWPVERLTVVIERMSLDGRIKHVNIDQRRRYALATD